MKYLFLILLPFISIKVFSQCTTPITAFPYSEGFEASNGGWLSGGAASDWAWGTPAKPVISTAGGGTKCWVTGGLNGSSYNNGESAWLQSPCFNFAGLQYPQITFKIFWETERSFDGLQLQYSLNGGSSWQVLGASNSNSCTASNWYNEASVKYLGNSAGWSGSTSSSCSSSGGSGSWLTASHSLTFLAGQTSVMFRFLFGAGTVCNGFDGIGIDDVFIGEAPANSNTLSKLCISEKEIQFSASANCITNYSWDFGDAASSGNTSTAASPSHIFSASGTYTITLTATYATGPPTITTLTVNVLDVVINSTWPGRCNNIADATLTAVATGSSAYSYAWNTSPPQTSASITNAGAGSYTVTVNAVNACTANKQVILNPFTQMQLNPVIKNAFCGNTNGSITTSITGGEAPYNYNWSNGSTASAQQNLPAGNYSVIITDINGCQLNSGPFSIINMDKNVSVNLGQDLSICPGQNIVLNPGNFSSYLWQNGSTNSSITINNAGEYFVTVTDADGCNGSDTVNVNADCRGIYFPSAFTPDDDGLNDKFGPLGNLSALKNYSLSIYDRYGNNIFFSTNPFEKWNGTVKGAKPNSGSFVWMSEFLFNGKKESRKGSITIVR